MDRHANQGGHGRISLIAVLLALVFAIPFGAWASSPSNEIVRLRIQNDKDNIRIEMPLPAFEYVLTHSKDNCQVGKVEGKHIDFKSEDLLKILKGKDVRRGEVMFLSVDEAHNGPTKFYVRVLKAKHHQKGEKPRRVVMSARGRDGKEDVRLAVSIDAVKSLTDGCSMLNSDEDFGPFIQSCLTGASEMGPGPFLSIKSRDGEEVTFSLE